MPLSILLTRLFAAVSSERRDAELSLNVASVAHAAARRAAHLADAGRYKAARLHLLGAERLMRRAAKTDEQMEEIGNFVFHSGPFDAELKHAKDGARPTDGLARSAFKMRELDYVAFVASGKQSAVALRRGANIPALRG